uniref:GIY-YIG nuclease family protein n=1 Tax=Oscillatoriales cyanobacterium SpSt-418 TaxID=2282169 RepID=A0A7C3PG17_9CYAN
MVDLPKSNAHYVYVVRCANGSLYTGYTKDIKARMAAHNEGKGGRYTRAHRPVKLVASWSFATKREALQIEYRIKQLPRPKKLELVQQPEILQSL